MFPQLTPRSDVAQYMAIVSFIELFKDGKNTNHPLRRAYILVFVQFVHAFEFHDPIPFPPFTRIAFGQPFSLSWTLDGSETGDRFNLRAKPTDSGVTEWIDLVNNVRLSDGRLTTKINRVSSSLSR